MNPEGPAISASTLPWAEGPYSVKRHGVTLTTCDSEPVQTPGCVQAHGVLLVLRLPDLQILQVSESCVTLLGAEPQDLLGHPLAAAIGEAPALSIMRFLEQRNLDDNPIYVLTLPARAGGSRLDASVHTTQGIAILELEATGRSEGAEPDYVGLFQKTIKRLQGARSVLELSRTLTAEVRGITGFDRVMSTASTPMATARCSPRAATKRMRPGSASTTPPPTSPSQRARSLRRCGAARCPTSPERSPSWCRSRTRRPVCHSG